VFTGIDGKDDWRGRAYQRASRTRALQQDPVTRLFLRGRLAEGCQERKPRAIFQRTGIEATLDKSERETLVDNEASVWRSAHTMRIAMTLHAAHAFTHAAAIDGSKNGVDEDAASGGNEAEHNAEDRLAPTAYAVCTTAQKTMRSANVAAYSYSATANQRCRRWRQRGEGGKHMACAKTVAPCSRPSARSAPHSAA